MAGIDITKIESKEKVVKKKNSLYDLLNKDISISGSSWADKKKESFYLNLYTLLSSGVDIRTALEIINEEQAGKKDQQLITNLLNEIIKGASLSEAIFNSGKFSPYEFHSLRIGEESGKINEILNELAQYFNGRIKQQRQLISVLSYPSIVLASAAGAVFFLLRFIVPMFTDVFKRLGGKLPAITQLLINFSNWLGSYFLICMLIILLIAFTLYTQRRTKWFRKSSAEFLLNIPFLGKLILSIHLARFCNSMRLLISSKVPILQSLILVRQMIGFYPISNSLELVEKDILVGMRLHEGLAKFSIYDKKFLALIKVGEEVNKLDKFFGKLSDQYSQEVQFKTQTLSTVIEPVMIIIIGLIVGTILIAMYLPLFQVSTNF